MGRRFNVMPIAVATALTMVAVTGCEGGDGEDPGKSASVGAAEAILIRTRVDLPTVDILDGSTVGGSPFCPGGTATDQHGTPEIGLVDRTITCRDGTLRVGFDPGLPAGDTQRGPWRIISGTGAYEGWSGNGDMVMRYDPRDRRRHPTRGRERYTGAVTR